MSMTAKLSESLAPLGATATDDVITFATGRGAAWRPPEGLETSHPAAALTAATVRIAAEHGHKRQAILNDDRLSDTGKEEKLATLDAEHLARAEKALVDVEAHAATAEAALAVLSEPPALERTDAVTALSDRESRDYLHGLPLHEQLAAIQQGPAMMAQAVLRSPVPIPEPVREAARVRFGETLAGDDRYQHVRRAADYARWSRTVAAQAVAAVKSVSSVVVTRQRAA